MATSDRFMNIVNSIQLDKIQYYHKLAIDFGIIDTLLYPYDYADTLIRLGYEPFPPLVHRHLFQVPTLTLPGLNAYVYYLYKIGGLGGLYGSVIPFVASTLINRHLNTIIINQAPFSLEHPQREPRLSEGFSRENLIHFGKSRGWKLLSNLLSLQASYPLYAVAVRSMARFVIMDPTSDGYRPVTQDSWLDELKSIKLPEIFYGMQARLLREIAFAIISAGSFLVFMKFLQLLNVKLHPDQADPIERVIEYVGNNFAATYTNVYRNVGDIVIINSTDIPLGNHPFTDRFDGCWDCLLRLSQDRKWKISGGGIFQGRPYTGLVSRADDGKPSPQGVFFGPFYLPTGAKGYENAPYFLKEYYAAWRNLGIQPGAGQKALEQLWKSNDNLKTWSLAEEQQTGSLIPLLFMGSGIVPYISNPFML